MTRRRDWFNAYESMEPRKVFLGEISVESAIGKGSIEYMLFVDGKTVMGTMADVWHVPNIAKE